MQVLCERSNVGSDVRCTVCGQGFLVYWRRSSSEERAAARRKVLQALRDQHVEETSNHHAHPSTRFTVSTWSSEAAYAEAELLTGQGV